MVKHRSRVVALGLATLSLGNISPNLNRETVVAYLKLHDLPKLMNIKVLHRYGYEGKETIYEILAQFYGKRSNELSPHENLVFKKIVFELNRIEESIKKDFFVRRSLQPAKIAQLRHLEHIADITDTGVSRKKEMGIKTISKYEAATWLQNEGDAVGAQISLWLEDNFDKLIPFYNSPKRCQELLFSVP